MRSWECKAPVPIARTRVEKTFPQLAFMDFRMLGRSFRFAFAGALHVFRSEQNMRVHALLSVLVVLLGWFLQISSAEWGLLFLSIGAVLAAECFNSSLERLADRLSQDEHYLIRVAKDAAAAGVLMVSLSSAAVGALIFLPKLWAKLMPM